MYIRVTVTTKAKREEVTRVDETAFAIKVKQKRERNEANRRVLEILREVFSSDSGTPRIRLVSEHTSTNKIFSIDL